MSRNLTVAFLTLALALGLCAQASAMGEDVLAETGQYTFFIRPFPSACLTFHQRTIPCVVKDTVYTPRTEMRTYMVPVPERRGVPVTVTETPVGCPKGVGPCATCVAQPITRPAVAEVWGPKLVPVRVAETVFVPKEVTRRVRAPQWFAVTEYPKTPKKVRKVHQGG